jgi:hypothetical protein
VAAESSKGEDRDENKDDEYNAMQEYTEEIAEGRQPKVKKEVKEPSSAERAAHDLTHIPFRSWCRHCVRGKAVEDPHRKNTDDDHDGKVPVVSMDYFWLGCEGSEI